jgi:hypothetical protein
MFSTNCVAPPGLEFLRTLTYLTQGLRRWARLFRPSGADLFLPLTRSQPRIVIMAIEKFTIDEPEAVLTDLRKFFRPLR